MTEKWPTLTDEPGMYIANNWFGLWDGKQWTWGGPPEEDKDD